MVREMDLSDATLVEGSTEFLKLLMNHGEGCRLLEEVEADPVRGHDVIDAQRRVSASSRQWRAALRRFSTIPAYSEAGILAKCSSVQGYFADYPLDDVEIMALINSLVKDIERLLAIPVP